MWKHALSVLDRCAFIWGEGKVKVNEKGVWEKLAIEIPLVIFFHVLLTSVGVNLEA